MNSDTRPDNDDSFAAAAAKDPDFFVVGPPRTGTSLLTVVLNARPDIAIAQDTSVFSEFKNAAVTFEHIQQNKYDGLVHPLISFNQQSTAMIKSLRLNFSSERHMLLMGLYFSGLLKFHARDTFVDDPRKDRGTGIRYLQGIDFTKIYERLARDEVPVREIFNYIIHRIITKAGLKGSFIGEKTPSHALLSIFLADIYENAKFINIIRNPITFIGSRRQRLDTTIERHCYYYNYNIEQMLDNPERAIFVRYEDLLSDADKQCRRIHKFLGLREAELDGSLDAGVYPKYVGSKVDPDRDRKNLEFTSEQEREEIKSRLAHIYEKFYPELLSG